MKNKNPPKKPKPTVPAWECPKCGRTHPITVTTCCGPKPWSMPTPTIPDWPSLWEREPGLRPTGNNVHTERYGTDPLRWAVWDAPKEAGGRRTYSGDALAALCRDTATRWLKSVRTTQIFGIHLDILDALLRGDDAALFAVCKAVLDARGETKP